MNKRSTLLFVPYLRVKAIKPSVSWVLLVVVVVGTWWAAETFIGHWAHGYLFHRSPFSASLGGGAS